MAPATERFRRRDGRSIPASGELVRYSTPEHLALEQTLIERVRTSRRQGTAVASVHALRRAIAARSTLSTEQQRLVRRLCLDGYGVAVVAGKAGTGKTYALAAARDAWQAAGHPVLGVAVARRAARELQEGAGIQSTSVAALLGQLRRGTQRLPDQAVLVVDEAGMVPTRDLAELLDWIEDARGKLVLVGDHHQLPELEAGGSFRGLVQRGLAIELSDNLRQVHAWERRALDHVREGRANRALALYDEHGRITVEPTDAQTRERMVDEWLGAGDLDQAVMVAHRRVDVAELNASARARLRAAGDVHGPELDLPGGRFAVGDRVVIKRNDRRGGVDNGDRGRVLAVDPAEGSLLLRCGDRQVTLDPAYLSSLTGEGEPTLLHAYAITGHVAQGMTVDRSYVLADEGINREWAYVALSRGRESNRLYLTAYPDQPRAEFAPAAAETGDPVALLAARLQTSGGQVLAIDTGPEVRSPSSDEILRLERSVATAERERRAIDARRHAWIAGLTGQRSRAHAREHEARAELNQARRVIAEQAHGALPHEPQREERARMALLDERAAERVAERTARREHGFGREL